MCSHEEMQRRHHAIWRRLLATSPTRVCRRREERAPRRAARAQPPDAGGEPST